MWWDNHRVKFLLIIPIFSASISHVGSRALPAGWLIHCPCKFIQYVTAICFLLNSSGISPISTCNADTGDVFMATKHTLIAVLNYIYLTVFLLLTHMLYIHNPRLILLIQYMTFSLISYLHPTLYSQHILCYLLCCLVNCIL